MPTPITEFTKVSPKESLKSSVSSDSDIDEGLVASAKFGVDDGESLFSDKCTLDSSSSHSKQKHSKTRIEKESLDNVLFMKRNILHEFERLSTKGYKIPKFTMASSYEDMRFEYEHIKKNIEVDVSVKFQRNCILGFISAIEFLNNRYDPFEFKLDGWTEQVSGQIETFDDIMEEIFHKYKNKIKMAPELSLAFGLVSSMFVVHLANTAFKPSSQPASSKPTGQKQGNEFKNKPNERPVMRGPSNISLADDTISIMSGSSSASHVSSLSSRITLNKHNISAQTHAARRTMHI